MKFEFPYQVAITAIIKNEGDYIKEWLDYHILAGISKFYLYDNESSDRTKEILEPYIQEGIVDYRFFPGLRRQIPAYQDSIEKHKFECKYMAIIDGDEFIFPVCGKSIPETLEEIFALNPSAAGLSVNWQLFGSSGQKKKSDKPVLQRFLHRAKDDYNDHRVIKSIFNPRCVVLWNHPHYGFYFYEMRQINETGMPVNIGNPKPPPSFKKIVINHYFTKSEEEWIARRSYGTADLNKYRTLEDFRKRDRNEVLDDRILHYIAALEKKSNPEKKAAPLSRKSYLANFLSEIESADARMDNSYFSGHVDELLSYWNETASKRVDDGLAEKAEQAVMGIIGRLCKEKNAVRVWEMQLLLSHLGFLWKNLGRGVTESEKIFRDGVKTYIKSCGLHQAEVESCVSAGLLSEYSQLFLAQKNLNGRISGIRTHIPSQRCTLFAVCTAHRTQLFLRPDGCVVHREPQEGLIPIFALCEGEDILLFAKFSYGFRFVVSFYGDGMTALSNSPFAFSMLHGSGNMISIQEAGQFLSARKNGEIRITSRAMQWELFSLKPVGQYLPHSDS